jgi:O-antigen ligase
MEYARPANPMKIPLMISLILFFYWITLPQKNWSPQVICFLLLLGIIVAMGPIARNNYSIWIGFQQMAVQLLCICIPILHFVSSRRKVSIFVNVLIVLYVYIAIFGILHGGRGPGGHIGDENDLALALIIGLPFAFVSILLAKNLVRKLLYGGTFVLMLAGIIATHSRGGFVGLLPVLLYCLLISRQKKTAVLVSVFLVLGVANFAPQSYWDEMSTISQDAADTEQGTGALRRDYWAIATRMFLGNPILGVGLGNFTWNVPEYQTEEQFQRVGRSFAGQAAHSIYFTLLAELGIAGSLVFLAIVIYTIKDTKSIINAEERLDQEQRLRDSQSRNVIDLTFLYDLRKAKYYAHAIRGGLLGYLVAGIFLSVFAYPHFWIMTALTVALKETTFHTLRNSTVVDESPVKI